jgi:hypothetical protein
MRIRSAFVLLALCAAPVLAQEEVIRAATVRHLLQQPSAGVKFQDVALTDALDYVRDVGRMNLAVDWKALEMVGVSKETPVNVELGRVPLRVVLKKVLESAGPGLLATYVDANVLHVTTHQVADEKVVVRVYPVQDLIVDLPDFAAPQLDLNANQGGNGGGGGGGNGGIFSQSGDTDREEKRMTRAERADRLIEIIQTTIRPEIWAPNGGKSTIRYYNGNLIIKAPRSVQDDLN